MQFENFNLYSIGLNYLYTIFINAVSSHFFFSPCSIKPNRNCLSHRAFVVYFWIRVFFSDSIFFLVPNQFACFYVTLTTLSGFKWNRSAIWQWLWGWRRCCHGINRNTNIWDSRNWQLIEIQELKTKKLYWNRFNLRPTVTNLSTAFAPRALHTGPLVSCRQKLGP